MSNNKIYIKCDEFTDTDNDNSDSTNNSDDILNSIEKVFPTDLIKKTKLIGLSLGVFLMLIIYFLGKMIFYKNPLYYFNKEQKNYLYKQKQNINMLTTSVVAATLASKT